MITPEALLAIDEQRVGLDLEIVLKTGLVLQQHLDTNNCLESVFLHLFCKKKYLMTCLVSHLGLIKFPVEQVNALLKLTHLRFGACNVNTQKNNRTHTIYNNTKYTQI